MAMNMVKDKGLIKSKIEKKQGQGNGHDPGKGYQQPPEKDMIRKIDIVKKRVGS